MRKIILSLLFLLAISSQQIFAQAPGAINYQAVARDNNGKLITSSQVSLRITILTGSSSGTVEYQETFKNVSTNPYGQFAIMIGTGNAGSYTFSDIKWSANSHWLKVEMDVNNGSNYQLAGTSQMVSVPYALYAEKSGSSSGGGGSNPWTVSGSDMYKNISGKVAIGLTSPSYLLHVSNDLPGSTARTAYFRTHMTSTPTLSYYSGLQSSMFANNSGTANNQGLFGYCGGYNGGINSGVYGFADSSSGYNRGVFGYTSAPGQFNQGVFGRSDGTTSSGLNIGVSGYAIGNSASNAGVFATTDGKGATNYGLYGNAYGSGSSSINCGVFGVANNGGSKNYAGYFSGDLVYTGSLLTSSDAKLKKDVEPMGSIIPSLMQLQPKTYYYKTSDYPTMNLPKDKQYGFIAQDLEKVFPTLVSKNINPGIKGFKTQSVNKVGEKQDEIENEAIEYKGVNYMGMIPILTQAIQEQQRTIDALQKRITELEKKK